MIVGILQNLYDLFFKSEDDLKSAKGKNEVLKQASIQSKDLIAPKDRNKHEVAIFPAFEEYSGGPWLTPINDIDKLIIDSLQKVLIEKQNINLTYSYYDLGSQFRSRKISEDIITEKVKSKLWQKQILSIYNKPNIDLICELGKELKVDAIITFWIYYDSTDQIVNAFFIDINQRKAIEALERSEDLRGTNVSSAHRAAMSIKINKVISEVFEKMDLSK